MELDDQLAALAAGELDEAQARALRARVAAEPALARRLARLERLDGMLRTWEAPELSDAAVARLDAAVGAALDALDDAPLSTPAATPLRPATAPADPADDGSPAPGTGSADVVDLRAAREARGVPGWVAGIGVAAALVAVVGGGVVVSGLAGQSDSASDDVMADQEMAEDTAAFDAPASADDDMADDDMADAAGDAAESAATDAEATMAEPAPRQLRGVELAEGELLALLDVAAPGSTDDGAAAGPSCVDEALLRDTAPAPDRTVEALATGTYADVAARFVVIRTPGDGADLLQVLAYDAEDCSLLAADETR